MVGACSNCPLVTTVEYGETDVCGHPDAPNDGQVHPNEGGDNYLMPPDWCPLAKETLEVSLLVAGVVPQWQCQCATAHHPAYPYCTRKRQAPERSE